jgi:hypothetical protein
MKPGELDLATGEIVLDVELEADMYRPHGPCANCGCHSATALWVLYKGPLRYEFRCACCVVVGKLKRAKWYRDQIAKLEAEYAEAKEKCP